MNVTNQCQRDIAGGNIMLKSGKNTKMLTVSQSNCL